MGWDWAGCIDRARTWLGDHSLSCKDAKQWDQVESIRDAAELTARWLEGDMQTLPGYGGRPAPETECIVPPLVKLNRSGFLTIGSQPGEPPEVGYNGRLWTQRAEVQGLADSRVTDTIQGRADTAGLLSIRYDRAGWRCRYGDTVPTSRCEEQVTSKVGTHLSRHEMGTIFDGYLQDELSAAQQLTVIDMEWGRNDLLWPAVTGVPALAASQCDNERGMDNR